MRLLAPLGLIGLIGLVILLVIYLLKPNYQQKYISSTYIWRLSLKYKKKKLPISKLRNILLLICQILFLLIAAFILAQPVIMRHIESTGPDKIMILDASASMRSLSGGTTRFERAVSEISKDAEDTINNGGSATLIVAGTESTTVISQSKDYDQFEEALNGVSCTYGTGDIDGAVEKAFDYLESGEAEIGLYTGTKYGNSGKVTVHNVAVSGECNSAILDVRTTFADGYYTIEVDVAYYGVDMSNIGSKVIRLKGEVKKANSSDATLSLPDTLVDCPINEKMTVVFTKENRNFGKNTFPVILDENQKVYSFDQIYFHIDEQDSISTDNEFYVYGGTLPKIKIQYYSDLPNVFIRNSMLTLRESWYKRRIMDIDFKLISSVEEPANEGYDVYIYEHKMPDKLPSDGVVLMFDPDKAANAGFSIQRRVALKNWKDDGESLSAKDASHPILQYVMSENIKLSEYIQIAPNSLDGYEVLLQYQSNPVFFVKNTVDTKIAVMAFSINKSTMGMSMFFPILMDNTLKYFLPQTLSGYDYSVYDDVTINSRGTALEVSMPGNKKQTFSEFPSTITADVPGTYTVTQTLMSGKSSVEDFYVRINSDESDVAKVVAKLDNPVYKPVITEWYDDLLVYLAIGIFIFSFAEWLLHSREGI